MSSINRCLSGVIRGPWDWISYGDNQLQSGGCLAPTAAWPVQPANQRAFRTFQLPCCRRPFRIDSDLRRIVLEPPISSAAPHLLPPTVTLSSELPPNDLFHYIAP